MSFIYLFNYLFIYIFIYLLVFIYLFIYLFICLFIYLFIYLPIFILMCRHFFVSFQLSEDNLSEQQWDCRNFIFNLSHIIFPGAPLSFFSTTPSGRVSSRFSVDFDTIDFNIPGMYGTF